MKYLICGFSKLKMTGLLCVKKLGAAIMQRPKRGFISELRPTLGDFFIISDSD